MNYELTVKVIDITKRNELMAVDEFHDNVHIAFMFMKVKHILSHFPINQILLSKYYYNT